jgi:Family of unknown function (DUF5908)
MPVFINEVVFRGEVQRPAEPGQRAPAGGQPAADDPAGRARLVAEVTQAVIDQLERELDRIHER